jgi:hypothetical protein
MSALEGKATSVVQDILGYAIVVTFIIPIVPLLIILVINRR